MPDPADKNADANAQDAGQPQPRRRRDLRRADSEPRDARTGTMPAVTPNPSNQSDAELLAQPLGPIVSRVADVIRSIHWT